jgi:hypothetical protein
MQLGLAMARFSKVSAAFWRSKRVAGLSDVDRLAMLYLLTAEHQTSVGVARIPAMYAAADLSWTEAKFNEARGRLVDAGLIVFDPETHEMFAHGWFRFSPPQNPKHALGMQKQIAETESELVRSAALREFARDAKTSEPEPPPPRRPRPTSRDPDFGKVDPDF